MGREIRFHLLLFVVMTKVVSVVVVKLQTFEKGLAPAGFWALTRQ